MVTENNTDTSDYLVSLELCGAERFCYRTSRLSTLAVAKARSKFLHDRLNSVFERCSSLRDAQASILLESKSRLSFISAAGGKLEEELQQFTNETNRDFLKEQEESLFLSFAISKIEKKDELLQAAKAHRAQLRVKSLEPFKSSLTELFEQKETVRQECCFCGSSMNQSISLPKNSIESNDYKFRACKNCSEAQPLDNQLFDTDLFEAMLHVSFDTLSSKQEPAIPNRKRPGLILPELLKKLEPTITIIENDDENLILGGKLNHLFEIAFELFNLSEKETTPWIFSGALMRVTRRLPFVWQLRELLQLSRHSFLKGSRFFSVSFGGKFGMQSCTFPVESWRKTIKPHMEQIRHYEKQALLGYGFWDYLLRYFRTGSKTLYPVMYRIARREEAHSVLRRDQSWQTLKKELLVTLALPVESEKRNELCTALSWALVSKQQNQFTKDNKAVLAIERI